MNKYLLSLTVFYHGDYVHGHVSIEELSKVPTQFTHFKQHTYVLVTTVFALSDDFLFLKCELYDLRINDTWLAVHTVDMSKDFYAEIHPYENHPKFSNDDEMVLYVSVSRYISSVNGLIR